MSLDAGVLVLVTVIGAATPLLLAALGELVVEKSGVLNLGVEGMMLAGAVTAFATAITTGSSGLGVVTGALAGAALALIFAVLTMSLLANQVATGLALTIFGIGLSALVGSGFVGTPAERLPRLAIPGLSDLPVVGALLFTMMVPGMVLLIPQFVLARNLGLLNTLWGLVIVYSVMNLALNTFLLRGFFAAMPQELFDAAVVDGAGVWRSFRAIALPLAKPGLATVTIFSFLAAWDEFTWAITTLSDSELYTLPIGIRLLQRSQSTEWGLVFAASLIALAPVLVIFVALQRHFVAGAFVGATKG